LTAGTPLGDSGFLGYAKAVGGTLTGWISGAVGALLSSDDYGSSVERAAELHPLWQTVDQGALSLLEISVFGD
jgi:hypothetical protein